MKTLCSSLMIAYSGASLGRWNMLVVLLYIATTVSADLLQDGKYQGNIEQVNQINKDIRVNSSGFESPSCPIAEDIAPCVCTYDDHDNVIDMDCTGIESEEQLKHVFEAFFPTHIFREFKMGWNNKLKVLESNVFGNISFEKIDIYLTDIEVIEADAFKSSYGITKELLVGNNRITSFPFDDIKKFNKLWYFDINGNKLDTIQTDSFHGVTSLAYIGVSVNHANIIGDFQNIPNLEHLELGINKIPSTIPSNYFKTGSSSLRWINIGSCEITSVAPDAFDIVDGLGIILYDNLLETIEEATWRPLFEGGVSMDARDNPLNCGCDLAWLFGDDHLLDKLDWGAMCIDGTYVHDLDPHIFDDC